MTTATPITGEYEVLSPEEASNHPCSANIAPFPVFSGCWTPNDRIIIGGGAGRKGVGINSGLVVCALDYDTLKLFPVGRLDTNDEIVMSMRTGPEQQLTCSIGSHNMVLSVSDEAKSLLSMRKWYLTDKELQTFAIFNRSGNTIATGGEEKVISLFQHPSGNLIRKLQGHKDAIVSLDFSPDDKLLCSTASEKLCSIWDVSTGQIVTQLTFNNSEFRIARFITLQGPNSTPRTALLTLVNVSSKGPSFLALWDCQDWKQLRQVKVDKAPLVQAEISHSGDLLAVVTNESDIFIYRLPELKMLSRYRSCHDLPSTCLAFSPDDSILMSVSADKSFKFIRVNAKGKTRPGSSLASNLFLLILNVLVVAMLVAYVISYSKVG